MLTGTLRESGSEFQRTLPESTRLDLKRSILRIETLILLEWRDSLKGNLAISVGGAFANMIFCMNTLCCDQVFV